MTLPFSRRAAGGWQTVARRARGSSAAKDGSALLAVPDATAEVGRRAGRGRTHEGLIDRQILGINHVRDDLGAPLGWDLAFLAVGVLLIVVGLALAKSGLRIANDDNVERARRAS